jgi:hypothetical protein
METQNFFKSYKILLPFIVIIGIITIVKAGYHFGQWLYQIVN